MVPEELSKESMTEEEVRNALCKIMPDGIEYEYEFRTAGFTPAGNPVIDVYVGRQLLADGTRSGDDHERKVGER